MMGNEDDDDNYMVVWHWWQFDNDNFFFLIHLIKLISLSLIHSRKSFSRLIHCSKTEIIIFFQFDFFIVKIFKLIFFIFRKTRDIQAQKLLGKILFAINPLIPGRNWPGTQKKMKCNSTEKLLLLISQPIYFSFLLCLSV